MGVTRSEGLKNLRIAIKGMDNASVKVGWFESAKYDDGTSVAAVAAQNEYGNPVKGIPPRPFMRPTVSQQQDNWKKTAASGAKAIMLGNATSDMLMEALGGLAAGNIRETISKIDSPPLSPKTIAARLTIRADQQTVGQLDKPLVFEGIMLNTLTHVVYHRQPDLFGGT